MTLFETAIVAIVEGITEFLPVSSTGHLILTADLLGIPQTDVQKTVQIAMQLGAILAAVALYGRMIIRDPRLTVTIFIAFLPTAIVGFLLHRVIKDVLLGNTAVVLWSLVIGGVILLFIDRARPSPRIHHMDSITPLQAVIIGLCQSVALVPGVSRAAATIVGGEMMGISRKTIVEFSFLLAVPTMAAATGYDLWTTASAFSSDDVTTLVIAFVLSFIVAILAIKWFLSFVKNHSFVVFGVYRILLAGLFFWFI